MVLRRRRSRLFNVIPWKYVILHQNIREKTWNILYEICTLVIGWSRLVITRASFNSVGLIKILQSVPLSITVKTRPLINPVNAVIFPYLTTDDTLLTTYFFAVGNKFLSHFSDLQYCVTIVHSSVCTTINYISRNREEGDIAAHELRNFLMSSFNLVLIDHIKY